MNKDREYLERNYMQLKRIRRSLIMMSIGILDGEEHYEAVADAIPHIERAIDLMKSQLEED
tara:strand:+ start:126 stop:308 length:183 start_codon:yes stop_codon:yes gene_type:complete